MLELLDFAIRTSSGWQELSSLEVVQSGETGCTANLRDANGASTAELNASLDGRRCIVHLRAASGAEWVRLALRATPDEQFLGLGERFGDLNQRGQRVLLQVRNGAARDVTYKPVPFLLSSRGYGLRADTDFDCVAEVALPESPDRIALSTAAGELALSLYLEEHPKAALAAYTADVGRPALPPEWVFGPWKSRDWTVEHQGTVLEDLRRSREHGLPTSVKLIDAMWEPAEHTFTFTPTKYPDPDGMLRELHANGLRLVLWIAPWMVWSEQPSEVYRECERRGFLIKDREGRTYVHRLGNSPTFLGSCFDFTNPEAVEWWQAQVRRLVEWGVDGFKTDFGEQVPEDAVFFDGRSGREMHNLFPRLYNQVTYEAMQSVRPGVLLARSAWDGSQAISAIWAGDQTSDFTPWSGLPSVIRAGQAAGASGFPYWASDVGGYFGTPTDETFVRWAQFGAFSPIMQVHGLGKREPWDFSERTLALYREAAEAHTRLFPYLYSTAKTASERGLPVMRAMALEHPEDPWSWSEDASYQYYFGESLVVAPVYYSGDVRHLRLPPGAWRDYWDGTPVPGGRAIVVPAPLERIPVFAKAGAIVPHLVGNPQTIDPPAPGRALAPDTQALRVNIYPGQDGAFTLYDGRRFEWDDSTGSLTVSQAGRDGLVRVHLMDGQASPSRELRVMAGETARARFA